MEKQYLERIPFGKERRLNLGFGANCPICNAGRGRLHECGCQGEECPQCGNPLVNCCCECLAPWDKFPIVQAIEASFSNIDESLAAGAGVGNRRADAMSPTDKAAVLYFTNNAPPEVRKEINRGFVSLFPGLNPCGVNELGERLYSSFDIAEVLGIDHKEVVKTIRKLETEDYLNRR